jgi:hypothetical protein
MKKCPHCRRTFDEDYEFCLEDGTRLTAEPGGFQTSGEMPTRYIPRPLSAAPAPAAPSRLPYVIIAILAAVIVAGGAYFFTQSGGSTRVDSFETVRTENSPAKTSAPAPAATTIAPVNLATPAVTQPSVPVRPRVSTARVRFAKGAVTSSVSGLLLGGEVRNYVLACRAGQQLSAGLSTSNGCAAFSDGSTTLRGITRKGDNTITVVNKCDGSGGYTLNITII